MKAQPVWYIARPTDQQKHLVNEIMANSRRFFTHPLWEELLWMRDNLCQGEMGLIVGLLRDWRQEIKVMEKALKRPLTGREGRALLVSIRVTPWTPESCLWTDGTIRDGEGRILEKARKRYFINKEEGK